MERTTAVLLHWAEEGETDVLQHYYQTSNYGYVFNLILKLFDRYRRIFTSRQGSTSTKHKSISSFDDKIIVSDENDNNRAINLTLTF